MPMRRLKYDCFFTCTVYNLPLKQAIPSQSASVELSEAESETSSKVVSYPTLQCVPLVGLSVHTLSLGHLHHHTTTAASTAAHVAVMLPGKCHAHVQLSHTT